MKSFYTLIFSVTLLCTFAAQAKFEYQYHQLKLKEYDDLNVILNQKVAAAKKTDPPNLVLLKEGLQIIFARPNQDSMIEKTLPVIKNEIPETEQFRGMHAELVQEAIDALKNPDGHDAESLVTYTVYLENFITEYKPDLAQSWVKSLVEKIRDAKIEISDKAVKETRLRMTKKPVSPSTTAEKVLALAPAVKK